MVAELILLKKNLSLSLQSGDSTASVRLDAMNEENMDNYLGMLKKIFDKGKFWNNSEAIYSMDESGMPLEPSQLKRKDMRRSVIKHLDRISR